MWQRFTERARRIIFFAQEEAARLGENYVGTEHILLGLVRENDSAAARILERLGVPLGRIRSDVEMQVTRGHGNLGQDMQLTPRAKRVIDLAYEEARQLNNNYIGTEHLLLGVIREGQGLGSRVLVKLGADLERTRREVCAMKEGEEAARQAGTATGAVIADDRALDFDVEAAQLLQLAQEEAALRNEACVGTEHLLLALTRESDSAGQRALNRLVVSLRSVRFAVERQAIGSPPGPPQPTPFTWHALRVIDLAYEEVRELQNDYVGAEHLLLALIREGDSTAAHALKEAGVTGDRVRSEARQLQGKGVESYQRLAGHFVGQARLEAEGSRKGAVSSEHLLLSLIQEDESVAARILEALGVSLDSLRAAISKQLPLEAAETESSASNAVVRPFTPRAEAVIERAREEARRLRSGRIGSEHLLLGLLHSSEGFGKQVLQDAGVTVERLLSALRAARAEGPEDAATSWPGPQQPLGEKTGERVLPGSAQPGFTERVRPFVSSDMGHLAPRLTERARRVIQFAHEEAARLGENYLGTEHLLLGLIRENDSVAARILDRLGVPLGRIHWDIERQVTRGHGNREQEIQITPRAKRAIDLAHEEARQLNQNYIGTEHLLLGLIREGDGLAARVLIKLGADLERARREVYAMSESERRPASGGTAAASSDRPEPPAQQASMALMTHTGRRHASRQAVATAQAAFAREGQLTDLVSIGDLTPGQARALLSLAQTLKATGDGDRMAHREILPGKALAMIFEKPSLRTRVTFEVGMFQLGGHAVSLQPAEIQLGQRETVADAARNLERWVDGIVARTFSHQHVVELAQNAGVPVINGLTDREHPCQALADFLTILEKKGRTEGLKLAFIGDGNNVAHSLLLLGAKLGTHVTIAAPEGYEPDAEILAQAREAGAATGASIEVTGDPRAAVRDADIIYTDVWASMGQEAEAEARAARFAPFQVNADLVKQAKWDAIVMHDLPAHRGQEITDGVMDGPRAVIFDQAENRLHAQKALLAVLLG